jgi:hypothetical protein
MILQGVRAAAPGRGLVDITNIQNSTRPHDTARARGAALAITRAAAHTGALPTRADASDKARNPAAEV